MPAAPEVLASSPDRTIDRDRSIDFRHVTTLANEAPLLHEKLAFVFRICPARSHVIKLGRSGHDIVTAITDLRRPEIRIELSRVQRGGIVERSVDDSVPHMTGRAGHRFLLILGIVLGIGLLNRLLHAPSWNLFHQGRLLIFQRRMTVQVPVAGYPLPIQKLQPGETGNLQPVTGNKKKPSFKEKREFDILGKEIAELSKEKEYITGKMNNGSTPFEELQTVFFIA